MDHEKIKITEVTNLIGFALHNTDWAQFFIAFEHYANCCAAGYDEQDEEYTWDKFKEWLDEHANGCWYVSSDGNVCVDVAKWLKKRYVFH